MIGGRAESGGTAGCSPACPACDMSGSHPGWTCGGRSATGSAVFSSASSALSRVKAGAWEVWSHRDGECGRSGGASGRTGCGRWSFPDGRVCVVSRGGVLARRPAQAGRLRPPRRQMLLAIFLAGLFLELSSSSLRRHDALGHPDNLIPWDQAWIASQGNFSG